MAGPLLPPNTAMQFPISSVVSVVDNVTITNDDINAEFAKIAESYKMDVETVKKALEGRVNELANNIFMSKIHDLLVNSNNIK